MEQTEEEETSLLRRLVENIPTMVWTSRPDGSIDFCSEQLLRFTGLTREDLARGRWLETVHPDDASAVGRRWAEAVRTGELYQNEVRQRHIAGGPYTWFLVRAQPVRSQDDGRVLKWFGALTDITDKKLLEAERAQHDHFRELFLGIVGHDLRGPLTAIVTGLEVIERQTALDERGLKTVSRVRSAARRMTTMVEQILDLTRARLGRGFDIDRAPCHLDRAVREIAEEMRGAHPTARIRVEAEGPVTGTWDEDRVKQVVANLLGNAIDHGDGEVRVSLAAARTVEATPRRAAHLRVHNGGPPIPGEALPWIFDPFRQGAHRTRKSQGLGLGLYIAHQIVEAHGGTISVTSSPETGTCFDVWLPSEMA